MRWHWHTFNRRLWYKIKIRLLILLIVVNYIWINQGSLLWIVNLPIFIAEDFCLDSLVYTNICQFELLLATQLLECAKNLLNLILGYSFVLTLSNSISVYNYIDRIYVILNFKIFKRLKHHIFQLIYRFLASVALSRYNWKIPTKISFIASNKG